MVLVAGLGSFPVAIRWIVEAETEPFRRVGDWAAPRQSGGMGLRPTAKVRDEEGEDLAKGRRLFHCDGSSGDRSRSRLSSPVPGGQRRESRTRLDRTARAELADHLAAFDQELRKMIVLVEDENEAVKQARRRRAGTS
ncbi:MAG: hypothetical protein R3F30_09735 [Planctomycetota bacterium]